MNVERIHEPISVLASFAGGAAEPLRFRWGQRTYKVEAVNGRWTDRQGDVYSLNFAVQSGNETFYMHFSSKEVQWWLDQVIMQ